MHHDRIHIGGRRFLLCQPEIAPDGRATGYGNCLRHIEQAVRTAAALDLTLYLVAPARPLNRAIYDIDSADVSILGQRTRWAQLLRVCWMVRAPIRYGAPGAWARARAAKRLRPVAHWCMLAARRRGWRGLDRKCDRWERRCRGVVLAYANRSSAAWLGVYRAARQRSRAAGIAHAPRLRLRSDVRDQVERIALAHGLDADRPIVTLHVREAGYRQRGAERQRHADALRNATIDGYEPAIRWLVAQGYQIVRIGDPSMTPHAGPSVLDVATAPWRSDAFELWAMLHSRFFISSDSGPYFLALLCRVPTLAVNVVQVGYYTARAADRYICKLAREAHSGERLSLARMLTEDFIRSGLDGTRWTWEGNDPADIVEAVQDMVAQLDLHRLPRTEAQQRHDAALDGLSRTLMAQKGSQLSLVFRRRGAGTISARFAERIW